MNRLDVILLVMLISTALCFITYPKLINSILKSAIAFVLLLVFIQLFREGYYWQYVPSYLLLLIIIAKSYFKNRFPSNLQKKAFQFVFVLLIIASIIPWLFFLPIPKLPEPGGSYKVGTRIFRWVDIDRAEEMTPDEDDKRNVVVQAWYPTMEDGSRAHSLYIDGLHILPEKIGVLPRWVFEHYDQVNTHGTLNAKISGAKERWPVIIFLTGNVSSRAFYTNLVVGLASRGYVVLAIDHPFEAMIVELKDGTIATTIEKYTKDEPNLLKFMKRRLDLRVEDVKFVLNQLERNADSSDTFFSSIDKNRIVITGHSLGGATAAVAMATDPRIKAAANIDGTLYGEFPDTTNVRPFLLLESKKDNSSQFFRYEEGNRQTFKYFVGGYRYEITDADHYSFTDVPFLLSFPARFLASHFLEFGNIPKKTNAATVEILDSFFIAAQNSSLPQLDSVISRYEGIIQKPIY